MIRDREQIERRRFLQLSAAGLAIGGSASGWFEALASDAAPSKKRVRSCILLWMNGGPSQMDTFDCKPGTKNGGTVKTVATPVSGIEVADYLSEVGKEAKHLAILRSMSTKEGDHTRAAYHLRTGNLPQGPIKYPTFGSLMAKELEREDAELPSFVSIAPNRFLSPEAYNPGFLGSRYAPLVVGDATGPQARGDAKLTVENISLPGGVTQESFGLRLMLLQGMESRFSEARPAPPVVAHKVVYERAVRLMQSKAVQAFDLEKETAKVRDRYGRSSFGQGCLLARRLVEVGVPFVEVTLGSAEGAPAGWDTHGDGFNQVKSLCTVLDKGWSSLMRDLRERGLLDSTLIVWAGEFGRTPKINPQGGRDHFPAAWTTVLAGGGVRGGQVIGKTSVDEVKDRPIAVPDFLATICTALGVDPGRQNMADNDRPIRIVDQSAKPVKEVLA